MNTFGFPKNNGLDKFPDLLKFKLAEDMTMGDLCQFINDSRGEGGVAYAYRKLSNNAESVINSGATTTVAAVPLDATKALVIHDSSTNQLMARVVTLNTSTYAVTNGGTCSVTTEWGGLTALTVKAVKVADNKVMVLYYTNTGNLVGQILSVSGTTVTANATTTIKSSIGIGSGYFDIGCLETDKAVVAYYSSSSFHTVICTIATNTITVQTATTAITTTSANFVSVAVRSSTTFSVSLGTSSQIISGTVSGNTITLGEIQFSSAQLMNYSYQFVLMDTDKGFLMPAVGSNGRAFKYSGGVLSFGAGVSIGNATAATLKVLDSTRFVLASCAGSYVYAYVHSINWTTLAVTQGTGAQLESTPDIIYNQPPAIAVQNADKFVVFWVLSTTDRVKYTACTVSGQTITKGSEVTTTLSTNGYNYPYFWKDACKVRTDRIAFLYYDVTASNYKINMYNTPEASTTISLATSITVSGTSGQHNDVEAINLGTDKILIKYGASTLKVRVVTASGDTLTLKTEYTLNSQFSLGVRNTIARINDSKFLWTFLSLSNLDYRTICKVCTVDVNGDITFGQDNIVDPKYIATGAYCTFGYLNPASETTGIVYLSSCYLARFTITNDVITFSNYEVAEGASSYLDRQLIALDESIIVDGHFDRYSVLRITNNAASLLDTKQYSSILAPRVGSQGQANYKLIRTSNSTFMSIGYGVSPTAGALACAEIALNANYSFLKVANNMYIEETVYATLGRMSVAQLDNNRYLVVYLDSANTDYVTCAHLTLYPYSSSQKSISSFWGIVQTTGQKGKTVAIATIGKVSRVHKGLVAGTKYYWDSNTNGLTATKPSTNIFLVGIALSSKELLVIGAQQGLDIVRQQITSGAEGVRYYTIQNGQIVKKENS